MGAMFATVRLMAPLGFSSSSRRNSRRESREGSCNHCSSTGFRDDGTSVSTAIFHSIQRVANPACRSTRPAGRGHARCTTTAAATGQTTPQKYFRERSAFFPWKLEQLPRQPQDCCKKTEKSLVCALHAATASRGWNLVCRCPASLVSCLHTVAAAQSHRRGGAARALPGLLARTVLTLTHQTARISQTFPASKRTAAVVPARHCGRRRRPVPTCIVYRQIWCGLR